jgi:hypothetical protein
MRRLRLGKSMIEFAQENNVPSVDPDGDAWLNQRNKTKKLLIKKWNGR